MLEISPGSGTETLVKEGEADDIYCAACGHAVTRECWRISRNGDHQHTVFNPAGKVYRILVFAEAPGVGPVGEGSTEFTWFRGHAWQVALCLGCGVHVGWQFSGPEVFFGLIKAALKTAKP